MTNNSDSKDKLKLGKIWESHANRLSHETGYRYHYMMVFEKKSNRRRRNLIKCNRDIKATIVDTALAIWFWWFVLVLQNFCLLALKRKGNEKCWLSIYHSYPVWRKWRSEIIVSLESSASKQICVEGISEMDVVDGALVTDVYQTAKCNR